MCMGVLAVCTFVHHLHAYCPWRPEESMGSPGTGIMDGYEPPCDAGDRA